MFFDRRTLWAISFEFFRQKNIRTYFSLFVWRLYRVRWCQKGRLSKREKSAYPMERSWETVADSRLCRRQMCGWRLNTTGSRTRGYSPFRASRLSDAPTFRNKDNQKGVWKTRTWIAGGFQASGFIMSVYKWRLKDAKLNSRGLLSPWKPRHTPTENRLEDGNRQRIQRLKVEGHADHTLYN